MKRKAPDESKLHERLAELNKFVQSGRLHRECKDEYDWTCHKKLFQTSLHFPAATYLAEKRKVAAWKPFEAKVSKKSLAKIAAIQVCFNAYSNWLNAILKELDLWFADHPIDPPRHPKYIVDYKIQFLNWVCRGLSVPYSKHTGLKLNSCLPLAKREKSEGPIRHLLRWYTSLWTWSRQHNIADALEEWSATVPGAPPMDFFLLWARNLYQESWCKKKLTGILEFLEMAQEYSRELLQLGKTQYSHPECRRGIQQFLELIRKHC